MPNTYPFQLHTTLRLVFHTLRPYSFLLGKESGSLCNLPCHPICLPGREHKAQYHSPQPLLTRPANRLSYWRERDKEPLMCPGHANHARHLGELRAVTKHSQQQPTVHFREKSQLAFPPVVRGPQYGFCKKPGPLQLVPSLPNSRSVHTASEAPSLTDLLASSSS